MLSMSAMSGGQASYYLGLAREDYYLEGGEPQGIWFGEGAEKLGLLGEVESDQLYNLFDGLSPDGSRALVQLQKHDGKAEHRPGWDLTFSAPKSVSVLWSQLSDDNRQKIQRAHFEAVKSALDYLQDTAAKTRRGKGGSEFDRTGLVVACFEHSTSRALDPQLHTHALVMNIGVREDGTTGTVSSLSLFEAKMAAGALYRLELSGRLERELGIPVEKFRTWFEISGVPEELINEFSKRRAAIEEELDRRGIRTAEGAAVAAIETRETKEAISRMLLFGDWQKDGQEAGWSTLEADRLMGAVRITRNIEDELDQAAALATFRLTSSQAHFTERDFIRAMAEEAQASGLLVDELLAGARDHLAHSTEIIRLGRYYGEYRFTTREMLAMEASLLGSAEKLSEDVSHSVSQESVVGALAKNSSLSEEQMKAIWHITEKSGALAVVSGMAGTGKTRMLDVAREIWQDAGFTVEGAALSARAASELGDGADIESKTIAKVLMDMEKGRSKLGKKSVLIVDEAGMVATPALQKLALYCEKVEAKLVLVGDEKQLQPIGPGAPFMELGERYGHAKLQDIRRQNDAWARRAVKDIAEGRAQEALDAFIERGLVKVEDVREDAMKTLIKDWHTDRKPMAETLILAGSRTEVGRLNRMAQEVRKEAGEIRGEAIPIGSDQFYKGDRVMFTRNHGAMGVMNGERGVVDSFDLKTGRVSVRLDSGERVSFEADAMTDIALGYASTTHKAQGATTTRAYVLAGGSMQDRELSYVQASRAREVTTFYLTKLEAGDEIGRLVREMERSRQKDMAHTILRSQEEVRNQQTQDEGQKHERRRR